MNKYFISVTMIISISLWNFSCTNRTFLKQGLVSQHKYFKYFDDSTQLPIRDNQESKIWFKDSCVIYEVKSINTMTSHAESGTYQKESYDLFKYTYLDLRTLTCQDYYHFSDTALPVCNYALKSDEGVLVWQFYVEKKATDLGDEMAVLPDTIIMKKTYKRIKVPVNKIGKEWGYIYYLDYNTPKNIFHINRSIDEMYPHCKIVRSELYGSLDGNVKYIFDLNIIKERLSPEEKRIFKNWSKNAIETKLPLISPMEAFKRCAPVFPAHLNIDSIQYKINETQN